MSEAKNLDDRRKRMNEGRERLRQTMGRIKHKIAVISGKGGVGKSTVTANLGLALAWHGYEIGILDADLHGPCIPKLLGMRGFGLQSGPPGAFPAIGPLRMKVVSMDFLLTDEAPLIWRGPLKMKAIEQFLSDIVWGPLDFLLVDLPPGTGDEALSVMQLIPEMDGVIIVTIPSEVSQIVVKKAVTFARHLKVPIIGVVENMSGFVCPKCGEETDIFKAGGGRKIAEEMTTPFLGTIPLDPRVCEDSDKGTPFIVAHAETPAAKTFMEIVKQVELFLRPVKPQAEEASPKRYSEKGNE